jgi:hypothetical protein
MTKIKVNISGSLVDADSMEYTPIGEPWSSYRLTDGTIIKIKLVISDVFKLQTVDSLTGLPQYLIRSSNVVSVDPPDISLSKREVQ